MSVIRVWPGAFCAAALAGCTDGQPIVLEATPVVSPDAKWEATLERVDNGLGFGQGVLFYEVHLQPRGTRIVYHGNDSVSVVFYIEATSGSDRPILQWNGSQQLTVKHAGFRQPGRQLREMMGVNIEYESTASAENQGM